MSSISSSCTVGPDLLQAVQALKSSQAFSKGALLFQQGSAVKGVYLVETGQVRILLATIHSQKQLLEVAGPGTMLGLSESMSGETYRITAEADCPTTTSFIPRAALLIFLRERADFCMTVVRLLSQELDGNYNKFRNISAHPGRPRRRDVSQELN